MWQQLQPQDFVSATRKQQLYDMINWCTENSSDDRKEFCEALRNSINADIMQNSNGFYWILNRSMVSPNQSEQEKQLLDVKPWDLAQYLGIYDYFYISQIISKSSLDDLMPSIARDDISISNPDLRANQVRFIESVTNGRFNIG